MEESAAKIEKSGTIVFLQFAKGSKSESLRPFLYINRDDVIRIMKEGDNPFENAMLLPYDGHHVLVKGNYGFSNTFMVDEITDLSIEKTIIGDDSKTVRNQDTKEIKGSEEK